tara:strand:- start:199 stop:480 length:282 start_codon:yes stop_codon:yes gene_type:complete
MLTKNGGDKMEKITIQRLEDLVQSAQDETNRIREENGKEPIKLGVGGAYERTYIYRGSGVFEDPLFSGTNKECEIFVKGLYHQRVIQDRKYTR